MTVIHKEVYGQAHPIVLIHGWAMHTGIWRQFAQQLALHNKVICLDLPGHGLSETISPYILEQISDRLIEAIDEPCFTVLGWSLGASVALVMANRFPQKINSIILMAGNPRFIQDGAWAGVQLKILQQFADNLSANSQSTLLRFLALQVNNLANSKYILKGLKTAINECNPPKQMVLHSALDILKQADLRYFLSTLECPVCVIQGDNDSLIPVQVAQNMKQIQPNCDINIISGAGHVPFLSHPAQVLELIKQFT